MVSEIRSVPLNTRLSLNAVKKGQEDMTAKLASDRTGVVGVGDIDLTRFLTRPFTDMRMFQSGSGDGVYGTLAIIPNQQVSSNDNPFYKDGTVMALDRAGTGAFNFNLVRTGRPPDGYGKGNTKIVQKRFGLRFNPAIDRVSYYIVARLEDVDYVMQEDERLDGDFFPGSIYAGVGAPYGLFDTSQYNGDPFTADGWTGVPHGVPDNAATKPVITSITPDNVTRPNTGGVVVELTGEHFIGCGFVFFGPYLPTFVIPPSGTLTDPPGAFYYRYIASDTTLQITTPDDMEAGDYTIYVIGTDGQIGTYESFTVNPGPGE
jgi:hypothetical protein